MKRYLYLLLAVALTACELDDPASRSVDANGEIQLVPGMRALGPEGTFELVRVVEDSRCPSDTTCVWAGEVKVELSTRLDSAEPVRHQIVTGQPAMVGELKVTVLQVQPERISTREIAQEDYLITLKMERAKSI